MGKLRTTFGLAGLLCFVLLDVAKWFRSFLPSGQAAGPLLGVAPSFLGTIGIVFLLQGVFLGRRRRILGATLAATGVMLGWEFAQALPPVDALRTFDWLDVWATLAGSVVGATGSHYFWHRSDAAAGGVARAAMSA